MIYQSRMLVAIAVMTLGSALPAWAQVDRVTPFKGNAVSGVVKAITKDEVTVQVGGSTQKLPTNTIRRIVFEGDLPQLSAGRNAILDGQYEAGLTDLQRVDAAKLTREESQAEYQFYRAYAMSKLALAGREDKANAAKEMVGFVGKYRDSWHFYDAAQVLGDLAMALGSADNAARYYGALAGAPFPEYKLRASYFEGAALAKAGKHEEAMKRFAAVAGSQAQSNEALRYQKMAKIGRVAVLAQTNQADAALQELKPLIDENDPSDLELSAKVYNAQGMVLVAKQDYEGATLAFLHTDLLFPAAADAHAEALKQLIDLWSRLGQPDRATATRTRLEQLYPGSK